MRLLAQLLCSEHACGAVQLVVDSAVGSHQEQWPPESAEKVGVEVGYNNTAITLILTIIIHGMCIVYLQ